MKRFKVKKNIQFCIISFLGIFTYYSIHAESHFFFLINNPDKLLKSVVINHLNSLDLKAVVFGLSAFWQKYVAVNKVLWPLKLSKPHFMYWSIKLYDLVVCQSPVKGYLLSFKTMWGWHKFWKSI